MNGFEVKLPIVKGTILTTTEILHCTLISCQKGQNGVCNNAAAYGLPARDNNLALQGPVGEISPSTSFYFVLLCPSKRLLQAIRKREVFLRWDSSRGNFSRMTIAIKAREA